MNNEPVALTGLINVALTATLAVLTITEVLDPEVAGAVGVALAAWIAVAAWLVRNRVTPWPGDVPPPIPPAKNAAKPVV